MTEYISRESMLSNLNADLDKHDDECEPLTLLIMQRFIKYVEDFPTADVQPIRRGRWYGIPDGLNDDIMCCSECKHQAYWDSEEGQQLFDYCPYCGSKMDLEDRTE